MTQKESTLSKSIYQNMLLKDTDELLVIWVENDKLEWSDEAFAIIHNILLDRMGSVPPQGNGTARRRRKKVAKEKIPLSVVLIFAPAVVLFLVILLIPITHPGPDDKWFSILLFIAFALFLFAPGAYFGWKGWFHSEQTKQEVNRGLPRMKNSWGILYPFFTYFLPDRYVPLFFLWSMRVMSIAFIVGGIQMILFLIRVI
jgi:hypothetical protein